MTIDLNVLALNCFVLQSADFTDLISVSASGSTVDVYTLGDVYRCKIYVRLVYIGVCVSGSK